MKSLIILILGSLFMLGAAQTLPITLNFPKSTYAPGTYSIPDTALPTGATTFTLSFDRSTWANGVTVNFAVDLTTDSGKTWRRPWCVVALSGSGGSFVIRGDTLTATTAQCVCAPGSGCNPASSTNRVSGTITISGGTVQTTGSLVVQ